MVTLPPGSALGRYRVVEQLGKGGMATVFRCHDPNLDRYVAVKVLPSYMTEDPTFIGRFRQEAQTIARLSHPNILQIYDFGDDKGFTYIVSELVLGGDLQDKLGQQAMDLDEVLKYMGPLSEALDYAHSQGIVHRDLKPANVLLDTEDRPILADFGLARMLESTQRFTQASQALGTPEYMAPEQAMGADADHRSDLYALGIMVYQMLLGDTPFRAETPAATLMAHVHKPLPLPSVLNPNIEPRLESTLLKSLAKEPDDRFQSAKGMVQSLATGQMVEEGLDDSGATAVLDRSDMDDVDMPTAVMGQPATDAATAGMPVPGAPGPAAPRAEPAGRPGWLIPAAVAAGVVVIAAAVGVVAMSGGGGDEPDQPATATAAAGQADPAAGAAPADTAPAGSAEPDGPGAAPADEPTAEPTAEPEPEINVAEALARLQGVIDDAKTTVTELRDADLALAEGGQLEEVDIQFVTRDELETITRGFFRREDLRQQVFEANELYKTLGLMDEEEELEDILLGIQLQQVYALFDDVAEKVYVVSDASSIGAKEELGVAAAYAAGIQHQLFDTGGMRSRAARAGSDNLRAVDALIKGDITQVLTGYIGSMTEAEFEELQAPLPDNKLLAAPTVIQRANRFPQREGATFVAQLYGVAEWEGVNAAYLRPPASTEQILHVEKYEAQEDPNFVTVPNIANMMGRGWTQVSSNTLGEFLLRTYLEEQVPQSRAEEAAAGWGGDRYSLLSGPVGERLLLVLLTWDSFEDSEEFFEAYQLFMDIKTKDIEGATSAAVGESGRKWITPDEATFVGQVGPAIQLIIGDTEAMVQDALTFLFEALAGPTP